MPRLLLASALLAALTLNACSKEEAPPPEAPAGPVAGTSPRATLDRVKVNTDLMALREGVKLYKADHEDALPPDLDSLGVSGLYYAEHYVYDAATGEVHCDALPEL